MNNLRIVVFGGSGFIGTRLVARLVRAGHDVQIADVTPSTSFPELAVACDVRDLDQTVKACEGMDVIYNLAAEHADDVSPVERYYKTNVDGARNVCLAAETTGITKMIFTSSVAVFGLPKTELDETAQPKPFNEYGRSKLLAEDVYLDWAREAADRRLTIVRPTVIFGEDNRGNFYNFLKPMASGKFVMIGAGRNRKSVAYVENIAAFLEFVMQFTSRDEVYNYVDPSDMDMNELVVLVKALLGQPARVGIRLPYWFGYGCGLLFDACTRMTGRSLPISAVRVKKFCSNSRFSAKKALETGFVPPVEFREALRRTIQHEFLGSNDTTTSSLTQK
jgi:nucleoside-diphosphate-sugar epimerase